LHMIHYRKNISLRPNQSRGFSLIEVLVTIVILLIGLLGLAGLQGRALTAQMESYQRAQALILLKDMADRIDANRANAASYITTAARGTGFNGSAVLDCTGLTGSALDLCEWHNSLLGVAETQGGGNNIGAMIGARGCVYQLAASAVGAATPYQVVVAWQGMNNSYLPDVTTATSPGQCGFNQYKDKNGNVQEALHRVVSLPVSVACLSCP
jgi:type IV pilus assembly protein PilV